MLGELNEKQIDSLLHSQLVGRLGCHAGGITYVVPVTYIYDNGDIICHSRDGLKLEMMRKNPEVCFETDHMENMANWQSVITWGIFEELKNGEAREALQKMFDKFTPLLVSQTALPDHANENKDRKPAPAAAAVVFRIRLKKRTGRFEKRTL